MSAWSTPPYPLPAYGEGNERSADRLGSLGEQALLNRRWGPLAAAGISAVLVTGLFAAIGRSTAVTGCASTIPVVVASSEEKSTVLAAMAKTYNRTGPTVDGDCVQIEVERIASGQAEQA